MKRAGEEVALPEALLTLQTSHNSDSELLNEKCEDRLKNGGNFVLFLNLSCEQDANSFVWPGPKAVVSEMTQNIHK